VARGARCARAGAPKPSRRRSFTTGRSPPLPRPLRLESSITPAGLRRRRQQPAAGRFRAVGGAAARRAAVAPHCRGAGGAARPPRRRRLPPAVLRRTAGYSQRGACTAVLRGGPYGRAAVAGGAHCRDTQAGARAPSAARRPRAAAVNTPRGQLPLLSPLPLADSCRHPSSAALPVHPPYNPHQNPSRYWPSRRRLSRRRRGRRRCGACRTP